MDFLLFTPLAIVVIANLLVPRIPVKQIVPPHRYFDSCPDAPVDLAALQDWLDKIESKQEAVIEQENNLT